jgi:2,3-bisphosphoglycerate-dependent phosphoglycerate mutase
MIEPKELFLIRHGESLANRARRKAEETNSPIICFEGSELNVPLSEQGKLQSLYLSQWFSQQSHKPSLFISSPYKRTRETSQIITQSKIFENIETVYDERLRERELGIFDRLTKLGAKAKFPKECEERERIGKFNYRPTNGESWADVALRLRSFLSDFSGKLNQKSVVIVTHEVVIRLFRYILEEFSEAKILEIDRNGDIENGAITSYVFDDGKLRLNYDNFLPNRNVTK